MHVYIEERSMFLAGTARGAEWEAVTTEGKGISNPAPSKQTRVMFGAEKPNDREGRGKSRKKLFGPEKLMPDLAMTQ